MNTPLTSKKKTRRALIGIWLFGVEAVSAKRLRKLTSRRLLSKGAITIKGRCVMKGLL